MAVEQDSKRGGHVDGCIDLGAVECTNSQIGLALRHNVQCHRQGRVYISRAPGRGLRRGETNKTTEHIHSVTSQ